MNKPENMPCGLAVGDLEQALTYGTEAFLSREYAEAEKELLWPRVWQMAERLEVNPKLGDFFTYNVGDESIVVVRVAEGSGGDALRAYYNVCPHRGRQLVDTPDGVNSVTGNRRNFICAFHGWTYDLEGANTFILDKQDWKGALTPECTSLSKLKLDTWGGWVWITMNPDSEPLVDYLGDAGRIVSHFQLDRMRYKWRQWVVYGDDPDMCVFESYAIERYPEGQEPATEWVNLPATAEHWGAILAQDFSNMAWVQKGMKSRGFRGTLPNPHQERKITNFHRNLARYMGRGEPRLLK